MRRQGEGGETRWGWGRTCGVRTRISVQARGVGGSEGGRGARAEVGTQAEFRARAKGSDGGRRLTLDALGLERCEVLVGDEVLEVRRACREGDRALGRVWQTSRALGHLALRRRGGLAVRRFGGATVRRRCGCKVGQVRRGLCACVCACACQRRAAHLPPAAAR